MNSVMVALPSALTPTGRISRRNVTAIMRRSIRSDALSTYQTSSASLSGHDNAFRPLTCAQPVMPGFASSRRRCSSLYRSTYANGNGLGPTRLISPRTTDQSCGSSSKLVRRSALPNQLSRCSSSSNCPELSRSSLMERSFEIRMGTPSSPARICVKSTGAPSITRTATDAAAVRGRRSNIAGTATRMSIPRFARPFWIHRVATWSTVGC